MKKYLSIDNGLLMLCMSLFLFMMFICTQLLVSGYIENRTPEEIYVVNEKQITEHQLNQLSHILKGHCLWINIFSFYSPVKKIPTGKVFPAGIHINL